MYAARVEDLRPGTFVSVICDECGHSGHVASETIQSKVAGYELVQYLRKKMRCEACDVVGNVIVDCRRALGYT
jgi:hypothetical protein